MLGILRRSPTCTGRLQVGGGWILRDFQVVCGTMGMPTATIKLQSPLDGGEVIASAVGTGPVDAAYKAVDSVVDVQGTLEDYSVNAVTSGIDSVATTRVRPSFLSICLFSACPARRGDQLPSSYDSSAAWFASRTTQDVVRFNDGV